MAQTLFGIETEYAFAVLNRGSDNVGSGVVLDRLFRIARQRLPFLPNGGSHGLFLQNGARFYLDTGHHPEMTTPECSHPGEVVRYVLAGDRILADLTEHLAADLPEAEILLSRCNVDYSGAKTTFGSHESYLVKSLPGTYRKGLVPHLISRIIYTGAGGFDPLAQGVEFMLSPRVAFLVKEVSEDSTSSRGILHLRDESLSGDGYHRLHLICGESLCSEIAMFLRIGTTALVVAMIDAGLQPGEGVAPDKPVAAMQTFARDPTCTAVVRSAKGEDLTAIAIQRRYLELAEAHVSDPFMPPWAGEVCQQWRTILDCLEAGAPDAVDTRLDWAIKLSVYRDRAREDGIEWDALQRVMTPATELLRQELFEIDTKFSRVNSKCTGIFATLDRAGVLNHRIPVVGDVELAKTRPPTTGRAWIRGQCVKQFAGKGRRFQCDWIGVYDHEQKRLIDLKDPFTTEDKWIQSPARDREALDESRIMARLAARRRLDDFISRRTPAVVPTGPSLSEVLDRYDEGNYEKAAELLRTLEARPTGQALSESHFRYKAWIQARRGFVDGSEALNRMVGARELTFSDITDYLCAFRFQGLMPPPAIDEWIRRGHEQISNGAVVPPATEAAFLGHCGYTLLRREQPREALRILEQACSPSRRQVVHLHVLSRIMADRGDANRMLGNTREATYWLREARRIQRQFGYRGDLADFTFTYRAKLAPTARIGLCWLRQARIIQTDLNNRMGEARTVLLQARLSTDPSEIARLKTRAIELRDQLPSLQQCQLFARVISRWEEWTDRQLTLDATGDRFWGV